MANTIPMVPLGTTLNDDMTLHPPCILPPARVFPQYLVSAAATLSALASSSTLALLSIRILTEDELHPQEMVWLYSTVYGVRIIGATIAGILAYFIGRKWVIVAIPAVSIVANIPLFFSHIRPLLFINCALAGLALGATHTVMPIYLCEISDDSHRGSQGTFIPIMTTIGQLIFLAPIFTQQFELLLIVPLVESFLALGVSIFLPETPSFLLQQGHRDKALDSLRILRGEHRKEWALAELEETESMTQSSWMSIKTLKGFFISFGLVILFLDAHITMGVVFTQWQIQEYMDDSMVTNHIFPFLITQLTSLMGTFGAMALVYFVEWRILLLVSRVGMAAGIAIIVVFKTLLESGGLVVFGGLITIVSSSLASNHLPCIIMAELLPPHKNVIFSAVIESFYFLVISAWDLSGLVNIIFNNPYVLFISVFVSLISATFMFLFVPECRGKPIKVIHQELLQKCLQINCQMLYK